MEEVNLRCSDKSCHKCVNRVIEYFLRSTYLLDETILHNYDTVAKRHSFNLIVCYIYESSVNLLAKSDNLRTHLSAKLRIQVGKRLIHKDYLRVTNNRTADSNTLSLTTRQGLGETIENLRDFEGSCSFLNFFKNCFFAHFGKPQ